MLTKSLLALVLAACGVQSNPAATEPAAEPDDKELPDGEVKPTDSHWCCVSVDLKTKSGEGCTAISGSLELINACAEYLYCSGDAGKSNGKTQCLD